MKLGDYSLYRELSVILSPLRFQQYFHYDFANKVHTSLGVLPKKLKVLSFKLTEKLIFNLDCTWIYTALHQSLQSLKSF